MKTVKSLILISILVFQYSYAQKERRDVKTPKGSNVEAYYPLWDLTQSGQERIMDDAMTSGMFPNEVLIPTYGGVHSATRAFNCHGYAWHMSENPNHLDDPRWIGREFLEEEDIYMTDGSYIEVPSETYPGKVSWDPISNHSAITTNIPGIWISKWGQNSLVKHNKNIHPYGGMNSVKYWKLCDTPTQILNVNFTTNQTVSNCVINASNTIIQNNSKVVFDHVNYTQLNGDFEVQLGSELEIK